jgi:hypothetical protein
MFGVMFLLPGDSDVKPLFTVSRHIMPELTWAWLFIASGVSIIYSLFCGINIKLCFYIAGVLSSLLWTTMAISMLLSTFFYSAHTYGMAAPAAAAPTFALTIGSWWVLYRYPSEGN